jgi:hypothetical protein
MFIFLLKISFVFYFYKIKSPVFKDISKMKLLTKIGVLVFILLAFGCEKEEDSSAEKISLLSISVNGATLTNNAQNISIDGVINMSFSSVLDPSAFSAQLSIAANGAAENPTIAYTNSNSKANIEVDFNYSTTYTLTLNAGTIGANGEELDAPINLTFSTQIDNTITSMAPCTNSSQCVQTVMLNGTNGSGAFELYSNYPIYEENASWGNLRQAVIVVHGASHNPDAYFSYLTNTLNAESLSENTVLIAPFFRNTATSSADDFYWSSTGWRDGKLSNNSNKISSFEVLDKIIEQLADAEHFPVLDQIIITGQSSGGRFTHVFAPSNKSHELYPNIKFDYVVSESQYFYYPDGQRIDESTNQLYTPTGCAGYGIWPFGFNVAPEYLAGVSETNFNQKFITRPITYLLGNGTASDPTLNLNNCSATLLGSSRYQRGENMFQYMELVHGATHNHSKTIANGITHNGSAIYQSSAFRMLLMDLLN